MSSKYDTIDLGLEVHDWQGATELALLIGLSGSNAGTQVSTAGSTGYRCNDYAIERRMIRAEERDEHPRGKWLYRVRPEGVKRDGVPQTDVDPAAAAQPPELSELNKENAQLRAELAEAKKTISRYQHAPQSDDTELRRQIERLTAERDKLLRARDELSSTIAQLRERIIVLEENAPLTSTPGSDDSMWIALIWDIAESNLEDIPSKCIQALRQHYAGGVS